MELIAMALLLVVSTCVGIVATRAILEAICFLMLRTALRKQVAVHALRDEPVAAQILIRGSL